MAYQNASKGVNKQDGVNLHTDLTLLETSASSALKDTRRISEARRQALGILEKISEHIDEPGAAVALQCLLDPTRRDMKEVKGREARLALVADLTDVLQRNDFSAIRSTLEKHLAKPVASQKEKTPKKAHRRHISPLLGDAEIGGPTEAVDPTFLAQDTSTGLFNLGDALGNLR